MKQIDVDDVRVAGALDTEVTADGIMFRRLPGWTRHQIMDIQLGFVITMPAGVRLELVTDTTEIEVDVLLTRLELGGRPAKPAAFDLVVDGTVVDTQASESGHLIRIDSATQRFDFVRGEASDDPLHRRADQRDRGGRAVASAGCRRRVPRAARLRRRDGGASRGRARADGSTTAARSATASRRAGPRRRGPRSRRRRAGVDLLNLGFGGQCMLDQMVARTIRDAPADFISVKAGINIVNGDTMRERTFGPALHGFLDTIRDGHPTTPLVLVSPIVCPVVEEHPGPTVPGRDGQFAAPARAAELSVGALTLQRMRAIEAEVVDARRAAGDTNLHYVDGLALFGAADATDLYDGLHPTADGYLRIGERFHSLVFTGSGPFRTIT